MALVTFASDFAAALAGWLMEVTPTSRAGRGDDPRTSIWQLGLQHRQLIALNDRGRILKLPIKLHL